VKRLFIVNLLSERVARKGSVLQALAEDLGQDCFVLDSFDSLPATVVQAATDKIDHVIIEGGDGTVQGVISAFLQHEEKFDTFPSFSIVPGGMTNQVAKNIGLKAATARTVKFALNNELNPLELPLLNIIDNDGSSYSGFVFSTGVIPQITRYTTSELHGKGIGGSAAVVGGILKGIRGNDATLMKSTPIDLEGLHTGPHLGTIVTTLPSLMMGLDPFWGDGSKSKDRSADGLHSRRMESLSYTYEGDIVLDGEFLSIPSGKFTVRPTRLVTFLK